MDIKILNYYIRHDRVVTHLYNVTEEKTVQEGKTKGTVHESVMGYGLTLDRALSMIIKEEMSKKEGVVSLREYLKEYKREAANITAIFKSIA